MLSDGVTELGVEETLDAVGQWHAEQTRLEVRTFVAAAHFADLHHSAIRADRAGGALPGMERPKRLGGAGTPRVLEFAAATFGPRIGASPYTAARLIADALDTRHRLPRLWQRVCAGQVPVRTARHVAQQTRDLSAEAAAAVDRAVADYADGRLSWSRFDLLLAGKIVEADPEAAAARERQAAEEEFAKVGQTNDHGQKTLYVRSNAAAVIRIDATIAFYAHMLAALGDLDEEDRRRAKAVLILANPEQALQLLQAFATHHANNTASTSTGADDDEPEPEPDDILDLDDLDDLDDGDADTSDDDSNDDTRDDSNDADPDADTSDEDGSAADPAAAFTKPFRPHEVTPDRRFSLGFDPARLLPTVSLYLHLYAGDGSTADDVGPVVRWEGEGPITTRYVRDLLGPHARFTIKPVLNPAGMAPVDGYEIPDRHREAVHLRTPADVFPFAANTTRRKQLDHTQPYRHPDHGGPPGQTGLHNLAPMTQFHHRVKTHAPWKVKQPYPGIYLWRDPYGQTYLVDHTGTRTLANTDDTALPDLTIDVYQATDHTDLHHQPHHAA